MTEPDSNWLMSIVFNYHTGDILSDTIFFSWSALTAVAGPGGVRCVARAGSVLAHEALARYALLVSLYIPSVLIRAF